MREQQFRQREDRQRMESHRPSTNLPLPAPMQPTGKDNGCWNINRIEISGAAHMPQEQQEKITKGYEHRCLGIEEAQSLLSDITRFYIEKGYTTSRAYLPQQDLTSKVLKIEVIEGKVEKLKLKKGDNGSLYLPGAFPNVTGNVLNLRDIEQGLDQLNRLSSNNATIDIAPGTKPGDSIVTIVNNPTKRWHVEAEADNYGSRSTGEQQAGATVGIDNPLGINDLWSVTARRSSSIEDWSKYSNAVNGFVSVPYGFMTFTLGWANSIYESKLITAGPTLRLNGDSRSEFVEVDGIVYRDQDRKITLSGTLTSKRQENDIADQPIAASSRPLTVFDLGATLSSTVAGGAGSLGVVFSRGLDILGAYHDPAGILPDAPHAEFNKITLNASWSKPFQAYGENMNWSSQATFQHGFDALYGTEQISIGGLYTVRGFEEESIANNTGGFIRNDLSLTRNLGAVWGQDVFFKPYLALDAGFVVGQNRDTPHGALMGGGPGLTLSIQNASLEFFVGHPVISAPSLGDMQGFHSYGRLTVHF